MPQQWGRDTVAKFLGGAIRIRIIGETPEEQYRRDLNGLVERSKNMKPVMERFGEYMLGSIDRNFKSEGRPRKWAKLKDTTIADRKRNGFGAGPILERTGKLRGSFAYKATNRTMKIRTSSDYFEVHQRGSKKRNISQRKIVTVTPRDKAELTRLTNKYIFQGKL